MINIDKIGDKYFYIAPIEEQHEFYPVKVNILDAEGDTLITIQGEFDSYESAEALVTLLNQSE